jgi:cell cycle sensor histidine kinase DivJ
MPNLVWIGVILAALFAAFLRGNFDGQLLTLGIIGALPAIFGIFLSFFLKYEWAQILILLLWIAMAIAACLFVGFVPIAILFLAAPVMAALFKQEKIIEALIISGLFAATLYFVMGSGIVPESPLNAGQALWAKQTGIMALIALVISTLFASKMNEQLYAEKWTDRNMNDPHEMLSGSIMRFSDHGNLVTANKEAKEFFDIDREELPVTVENLIHSENEKSRFISALKTALETGGNEFLRLNLGPQKQGSVSGLTQTFDTHIFPHRSGGLVLHAINRTEEEKRLEELRRHHAATVSETDDKTLFFAGVSHELRTPLNAIIGFSDMMRSRLFGPLPSKYAEYADLIHDSGQHMLDLIGDVLDLSKVEAGRYTLQYDTFDAADVIRSSAKMLRPAADAANVKIQMDITTDDILLIEADRKAVRQILLNLLSNAVKFSRKGQTVFISAQEEDSNLVMRVKDNGEGISPEDLKTIGTPYTQSQSGLSSEERGSGLGLSLVKSLTELHEGHLEIKSKLGEGTQVFVSLPLINPNGEI